MKITTELNCPLCKSYFEHNPNDNLSVDLNNMENIYEEYPIQDGTWASRRWNKDRTDSIDLSGGIVICPNCYKKRAESTDVSLDGHLLCKNRGCPNDADDRGKYCGSCYDVAYQVK